MSALANHIDVTGVKMEEGQIFKVKVIFVLNMLRLGCMKKRKKKRIEIPGILLHMLLSNLGWKYNFVIHKNIAKLGTENL